MGSCPGKKSTMSSTSFLAFAMLVVLITLSLSQPGKGAPTDADPERAAGPNYPSGREPVHMSWLRPETGLAWPGPNYPNGKEPVHTSWLLPGNKLPSWSQPGNKLPSWSQPGKHLPSWSQPGNKLPSLSLPGNK